MNELIKINSLNYGDVPTISGRELHKALEINSNYTTWFNRMCEYGFVEGEDFITCFPNLESENQHGGQNKIDHLLTIDTAKEICMLQRTEIGRTIRKYFIETEKQYKQQSDSPALLQYVQSLESRIATLESKQTKTRKALSLPEEEPTAEIKLVLNFIDECCMKRANGYNKDGISTRVLYDYFVNWCYREKKVTPPEKTDFIKGICKFLDIPYKNKTKIRRRTNAYRYYIITLRPEYIK